MHRGGGLMCSDPDVYKGKEILLLQRREEGEMSFLGKEIWSAAQLSRKMEPKHCPNSQSHASWNSCCAVWAGGICAVCWRGSQVEQNRKA